MLPPEVVYPWSPPEFPEVSWVSSLEQELRDLCDQHLGLASATNHRFQWLHPADYLEGKGEDKMAIYSKVVMEDYSKHDKLVVTPQFGDVDLKEWLAGVSSPSPLPEMNNHQVLKGNTAAFLVVISEGGTGFGAHIMPLFGHQDVGMLHRALAQSLLEDKSYSVTEDDAASKQTNSDHKIKDFLKRSMPESSVKMQGAWGRLGPRKCRTRSTSWRNELTKFGADPSTLGPSINGIKFGARRINDRWTFEEMCKLVEAVSKHGIGKWTAMKRDYFKTSIRERGHLKDKWRDLLRACGLKVGLKNKVEAHKDTQRIVEQFKDKIINIYRDKNKKKRRASGR